MMKKIILMLAFCAVPLFAMDEEIPVFGPETQKLLPSYDVLKQYRFDRKGKITNKTGMTELHWVAEVLRDHAQGSAYATMPGVQGIKRKKLPVLEALALQLIRDGADIYTKDASGETPADIYPKLEDLAEAATTTAAE